MLFAYMHLFQILKSIGGRFVFLFKNRWYIKFVFFYILSLQIALSTVSVAISDRLKNNK